MDKLFPQCYNEIKHVRGWFVPVIRKEGFLL